MPSDEIEPPFISAEPICELCREPISAHAVSHDAPKPDWVEARFPDRSIRGFYCRTGKWESDAT